MSQDIAVYSTGTVTWTTGGTTITGISTAWVSGNTFNVRRGHLIVIAGQLNIVDAVSSATSITTRLPLPTYPGSAQTYIIFQITAVQSPVLQGLMDRVLGILDGVTLFVRAVIDSGAMRMVLRDDGSGNASIFVGNTLAPDGSTVKAVEINRTSGAIALPASMVVHGITLGRGGGSVSGNTASGLNALSSNTTGSNNTGNGANALNSNTTGSSNTASGVSTLTSNTTGSNNTGNGVNALSSNTTGGNNTASGVQALNANTTGSNNTASGLNALSSNTTGGENTASGVSTLYSNTTGGNNTGSGVGALYSNTTGGNNTGNGVNALLSNTTGGNNTANGKDALSSLTTFSNSSGLGFNAQVTGSNQVQLGDAATTTYVYGTVQNRSDARDKADIRNTTLGLEFVLALRAVDFRWDMREDYKPARPAQPAHDASAEEKAAYLEAVAAWIDDSKLASITRDGGRKRRRFHSGLIAQEVRDVIISAGFDPLGWGALQDHAITGGDEVMSLGYDQFIAPLIRAVQEQQALIQTLEDRIATLENA